MESGCEKQKSLAWEFSRASRHEPKPGFWLGTAMIAIRSCGFALGAAYLFGAAFGITFGVLSTAGQIIAYRFGIRPDPRFPTRHAPAYNQNPTSRGSESDGRLRGHRLCQQPSGTQPGPRIRHWAESGLAIGAVTAIAGSCTPFVEWTADHVPARRRGVFGVALILIGFTLQSIQYWASCWM